MFIRCKRVSIKWMFVSAGRNSLVLFRMVFRWTGLPSFMHYSKLNLTLVPKRAVTTTTHPAGKRRGWHLCVMGRDDSCVITSPDGRRVNLQRKRVPRYLNDAYVVYLDSWLGYVLDPATDSSHERGELVKHRKQQQHRWVKKNCLRKTKYTNNLIKTAIPT